MPKKHLHKIKKVKKKLFPFILGMMIILAPVVAWSIYKADSANAAWLDYNYAKRKTITITNNGSAQTTYNIQLIIDTQTLITAGQMQSDCDDARFATTEGVSLSYYYEAGCNTSKTSFWVQIPTIAVGSSTIYMYFSNGSANTASSYLSPVGSLNYGIGTDGDISFSTDKNINTDTQISGRSCADGGDAVNYSVTANTSSGQATVVLATTPSSGCLTAGDEVLIINLMGTSGANSDVGEWETARIQSISVATLTLDHNLVNGYDGTTQKIMVQRVPNYNDVTITTDNTDFVSSDFDGTKGGVMMFRADGTVSLAANTTINANAKGFRGGAAGSGGAVGGNNGESYDGSVGTGGSSANAGTSGGGDGGGNATAVPSGAVRGGGGGGGSSGSTSSANGGGGGGGGAYGYGGGGGGGSSDGTNNNAGDGGAAGTTSVNGGGGGGGISGTGTAGNGGPAGSAGSQGGSNSNGGTVGSGTTSAGGGGGANANGGSGAGGGGGGNYGSSTLANIYLGSGGGGGGDSVVSGTGGDGGDGGGIIFIGANTLTVAGTISATGANGTQATANAGSGGSGSGGSVYINATASTLGTTLVTAAGGAVVADTTDVAGAGAGGSGRIYNVHSTTSGTTSPTATSSTKPVFSSEGSSESQPTTPQLAAHWKLDEGNGTTASDSTSTAADGTLAGSTLPTWEDKNACYKNRCLFFDGSTSSVTVADTINLVRSVSVWVKPTDVSAGALIDLNGTARVTVSSGTISASGFTEPTIYVNGIVTTTLEAGKWQQVVVTTATALTGSAIKLGNYSTTYLKGFIDEAKIFTSTLTASEVKSEYAGGAITVGNNQDVFLSSGLVGYWTFNHTSGNASDKSGYTTTLTNNNTATYAPAKYGNGTELNGTTQYFDAADNAALSITGSLVLSAWIEPDDTTGSQDIVGKFDQSNESYLLALEGDEVRMYVDSASNYATTTAADIQANTKTMITGVYDATMQTVKIYVNGTLSSSSVTGTIPSSIGDDAGKFSVGAEDTTGTPANHFDGIIDDVRVFNKTLASEEITKLFNTGQGPVAYYNMDNLTTLTTTDGGLSFDGSASFVELPSTLTVKNLTQYSVSAWIYATNLDSALGTIYEEKRGATSTVTRIKLAVNTDNKLLFSGRSLDADSLTTWVDSNTTINEDTWYHVVAVFDSVSDTHYLYINGGSESGSVAASTISNTDPLAPSTLGALKTDATTESEFFEGKIRDVAVYNTALTSTQVTQLYTSGVNDTNTNLMVYFPLDEGTGQTVTDDKQFLTATLGDNSSAAGDDPIWVTYTKTGTIADVTGNANTGTVNNYLNAFSAPGKFGNSLNFNGSTQYLETADSTTLSITGDLTLAAWIKPRANTAATEYTIAGKWDASNKNYLLAQYGDEIRMYINSASNYVTTNSADLATNAWYHIEGVYNANAQTVKIYVNGAQQSVTTTGTIPTSISDSTAKLYTGALNTDGTGAASVDLTVAASSDDAVLNDSAYNDSDTTILIGGVGTAPNANYGQGFRFNNVTIPKGASVTSAYMTFMKDGAAWQTVNWRLTAIDEDDTATFSSGSPPGSRPITTSYIAGEDVNVSHTSGVTYTFPTTSGLKATLGAAIEQVVNRSGWASGNDLAIVNNSDQDSSAAETFGREIYRTYDYGTPATNAPKIHIDYEILDSQSNAFNGYIDEVKVYSYARSDTQVIEDLNGGHPAGGSPISSKIVHYKFDERQGSTANNSNPQLSSLTGSVSGATWFVQNNCKIDGCLDFDGSDDVVTVTNASSIDFDSGLSSAFTIAAWINPDTDGESDQGQIFYKGTNTWCRTDTESGGYTDIECSLDLATTDATVNISQILPVNTWSHFGIGYTDDADDEITVYINGLSVGSSTNGVGGPATGDTNNLLIGGNTSNNLDGSVDDFKIYTTELTAAQMKIDKNASAAFNAGTGSVEGDDLADGAGSPPSGWWKLDENTGTSSVVDSSGNNYTGTLEGSMTSSDWVRGKIGSALDLDGSNDSITIGDNLDVTNSDAFSISMWVNRTSVSADQELISKKLSSGSSDSGYSIYQWGSGSGGNTCLYASDGANQYETCTPDDATITTGAWEHIVVVYDNATTAGSTIYINGVDAEHAAYEAGSPTTVGSLSNTRLLCIGRGGSGVGDCSPSTRNFSGKVDDVRFYMYALTPAQVSYIYNRGKPVGWWKFDECSGTTANDSSGRGISGTITPGASTHTSVGTCNSGSSSQMWDDGYTGKRNYSLDFDGGDDYVDMNDSATLDFEASQDFTISGWFNRETYTTDDTIVAKRNGVANTDQGYIAYIDDTNDTLIMEVCDATSGCDEYQVESTTTFTATGWNHFVIVWDDSSASNTKIYINGVDDNETHTGTISNIGDLANSVDFRIGGESDTASATPFAGELDDVKVFNYALSADEIKKLYNNSTIRFGAQ